MASRAAALTASIHRRKEKTHVDAHRHMHDLDSLESCNVCCTHALLKIRAQVLVNVGCDVEANLVDKNHGAHGEAEISNCLHQSWLNAHTSMENKVSCTANGVTHKYPFVHTTTYLVKLQIIFNLENERHALIEVRAKAPANASAKFKIGRTPSIQQLVFQPPDCKIFDKCLVYVAIE
jgi:hypothetical protein